RALGPAGLLLAAAMTPAPRSSSIPRPIATGHSVAALSDAAMTLPSLSTASRIPCGWIDPGMWIGSCSHAVRSKPGWLDSGMAARFRHGGIHRFDHLFERYERVERAFDHCVPGLRPNAHSFELGTKCLPVAY